MSIQDEILDSIEIMLEKSVRKLVPNSDFQSVVLEVRNNLYRCTIEGADYWIKCGFDSTLKVGDSVWIHVPNASTNYKTAFIMARR